MSESPFLSLPLLQFSQNRLKFFGNVVVDLTEMFFSCERSFFILIFRGRGPALLTAAQGLRISDNQFFVLNRSSTLLVAVCCFRPPAFCRCCLIRCCCCCRRCCCRLTSVRFRSSITPCLRCSRFPAPLRPFFRRRGENSIFFGFTHCNIT